MSQQYPYGGQQPPYQYPPSQYGQQQPQLYPPPQGGGGGGSRPASPYQQPAQPYPGQGYPQQQPPSRTPSPYQQPMRAPSPYQQQQGYPPQGYPTPQPQYPYPPTQGYPASQPYPPQTYPGPNPGYQYGPPQPQPQQQQQPYTLTFQPTSQKHTSSLTPPNSSTPLYLLHYNRPLIATTRPEISITSPSQGDQEIATVAWHTWSSKIDLSFLQTGVRITYKDNLELVGTAGSQLGRLFWTLSQGDGNQADIKCADRTGATVVTIVLRDRLSRGKVEVWRHGLPQEVLEQVIVSAVAEMEDWRRKVESSNAGVNPGILAGTIVATGN